MPARSTCDGCGDSLHSQRLTKSVNIAKIELFGYMFSVSAIQGEYCFDCRGELK
jgi:hypothetical protein